MISKCYELEVIRVNANCTDEKERNSILAERRTLCVLCSLLYVYQIITVMYIMYTFITHEERVKIKHAETVSGYAVFWKIL